MRPKADSQLYLSHETKQKKGVMKKLETKNQDG